jgi:predicted transcriptional regulator
MKRKAAPSVLWRTTKIPRLEGDLALNGLKEVNHLERFSLQKLQETIQQEDKENRDSQQSCQEVQTIEKNYLLTSPQSKEVCFAVEYKSLKKAPNNSVSQGTIQPNITT